MRLTSSSASGVARAGAPQSASAARHMQRHCLHMHLRRTLRSSLAPVAASSQDQQQQQQQRQQKTQSPPPAVSVRFRVVRRVSFGERVAVVGASPELGAWDVAAAPRLRWSEGHEWRAVVDFPCKSNGSSSSSSSSNGGGGQDDDLDDDLHFAGAGALSATEYKFVVVNDEGGGSGAQWESGDNRLLDVAGLFPGPGMAVDVAVGDGGGGRSEAVASVVPLSALEGTPAAEVGKSQKPAKDNKKKEEEKHRRHRDEQPQQQQQPQHPQPIAVADADTEGRVGVGAAGWLGRGVAFMTSNDHARDRPTAATWEVPRGLPEGHPAAELIRGDRDAPSWLEKLRVAQRVLVDRAPRQRPRLQAVAHAYAYLQWVATGAVPCAEGGGHFRPNHHARAAQAVFRSLEWALEEDAAEAAQRARREQAGGHGGDGNDGGDDGDGAFSPSSSREDDDNATEDDEDDSRLPPRLRTLLARRLSTKLPSFGEQFTQSVPLTRIRDIAHRGDIPHDLKQEIKHTLQNKLHRNAGPEDLVAAETMLARLESGGPGAYPDAFLSEFRTFVAELREFFGAASLAALLRDGVRPSLAGAAAAAAAAAAENDDDDGGSNGSTSNADDSVRALDHFLARKRDLDAKPPNEATLDDLVAVAHALVTVRALLLRGLSSGMRNDAPDAAAATRQRWRLAEARAEDYLFVLLARVVGGMMAQGGGGGNGNGNDDTTALLAAADTLARGSDRAWAGPLGAAVLGLRSLALSGWQPAECAAVDRELSAWQDLGGVAQDSEGSASRLRASLDRAQRVCASYTDAMLAVLPPAASRMGPALGVPAHAIATFAEAEVRASVAFQLSRLLAVLQRAARAAAARAAAAGGGGPAVPISEWEPIVAGTARGVLVDVLSLDSDAARRAIADAANNKGLGGGGVVLLLREATGDEELGGGGGGGDRGSSSSGSPPALRGIALAQPLPHLSHLGVRARQERVPLATISPSALAREVLPLVGKPVELRVGSDGSTVELRALSEGELMEQERAAAAAAAASTSAAPPPPSPLSTLEVDRSQALEVVALSDARAETCGAKAASCARLLRLASSGGGAGAGGARPAPLFRAPRGAVLPFGAMEAAADAAGVRAKYDALLDRADALSAGASSGEPGALAQLDAACAELRGLVSALRPPAAALERALAAFDDDDDDDQASSSSSFSLPTHLIARSSANVEDLAGLSGAGLYDSVPNVPFSASGGASGGSSGSSSSGGSSREDLGAAVARVWASLHTRRAVLARRAAGVPQCAAAMAVLVQEQLSPDVSFVLHTRSPVVLAAAGGGGNNGASSSSSSSSSTLALAELAPGLGETLAGASKGSGWRLLLDKQSGALAATLAFANFSEALVPPAGAAAAAAAPRGGGSALLRTEALYAKASGRISGDVVEAKPAAAVAAAAGSGGGNGRTYALARVPVDYSRQRLSASADARRALGAELARVSAALEAEFGGEAQDAEGCVVGFNTGAGAAGGGGEGGSYRIFVVQSRPQPRE